MRWKYLTLARLRELGITVTQLPDAQALALIYAVSAELNALTAQFFQPVWEVYRASGRGDRLVNRDDLVPVVELEGVSIDPTKTRLEPRGMSRILGFVSSPFDVFGGPVDLDRVALSCRNRCVELTGGEFSNGIGNVKLQGVFGWLENIKSFKTTLSADFNPAATTISLAEIVNTTGVVEVGDFVMLVVQALSDAQPAVVYMDMVQAITGTDLTVDASSFPAIIPLGSEVRVYGAFPAALREVIEALVLKAFQESQSSSGGSIDPNRIISETTDQYSYTLEAQGGGSKGGLGNITGSARLDKVLQSFAQPPFVGYP